MQKQLFALLETKVFTHVPVSNIFQYTDREWTGSKHGGVTEAEHNEYLDDFAADFITAMQALIDDAMKRRPVPVTDEIYLECLTHAHAAVEKRAGFFGFDKELKLIKAYINDHKTISSLVLCGPPGCGKSALIAKAASLVRRMTVSLINHS